ncbi:CehA/McbA family metallohydrolase [Radiobacillus deserti]|uniref:PHP domain-containing protein n=1 Tax=Radiobacillus deserti TaxID=2594883 RepID=A0A516KK49_9BACI|nr:CehA/McbA family metallohydrolase [Radiobacillus deserti]QDP41761.1 PHP domain-containing protein [Radiobacillus deserti]
MRTLLETRAELTKASMQSHTTYMFYVPEDVEHIMIDFSFDPPHLQDESKALEIVRETLRYYELEDETRIDEQALNYLPVKNLLTISIDDPDGFRGARHAHLPKQNVRIGETESSPGMLNRRNPSGLWSITISAHAIVSDICTYTLIVRAAGIPDNEKLAAIPWQNKMLNQGVPVKKDEQQPVEWKKDKSSWRWVPAELHSHTYHSDGVQTVQEMVDKATEIGLEVVAITDHNTVSPLQEMEQVQLNSPIKLLYGLEWTTFYGHVLTIGYKRLQYTEWRNVGPKDIGKGIEEIHRHGALVGIAHPFRIGNPIGTGCHWEFAVEDIQAFDFMEVWNSERPGAFLHNHKAFNYWTDLLNKGYQIPATAGRDWHHNDSKHPMPAKSYIHMPSNHSRQSEDFRTLFLDSIRTGAITASYGNPLQLEAQINQTTYVISDRILEKGMFTFRAYVEPWESMGENISIRLVTNLGILKEKKGTFLTYESQKKLLWIRAELYTGAHNVEEMIAFTNPIYFIP